MKEFVKSACMFILDFLLFFFRYIFREFPCFSILPVLTICCFVRGISFGGIYFLDNIFGSLLKCSIMLMFSRSRKI